MEFPFVGFLGQASVTDQEVKAFYDANPARFPAPAKTDVRVKDAKSDPAADFAAVQPQGRHRPQARAGPPARTESRLRPDPGAL